MLKNNKYIGRICEKHPEQGGQRYRKSGCCIGCVRAYNLKRNKERYHSDQNYRKKVIARVVEYGQANVDARRKRANKSHATNKDKYRPRRQALGRLRRARLIQAKPPWMPWSEITIVYKEAHARGLTVDHIVPLKGVGVCGLHVPWNLEPKPLKDNLIKGNRYA